MRLTLLGSGNAAGMPVYGCDCDRCTTITLTNALRRRPASALLEVNDRRYLIDAGLMDITDRFPAGSLDGIFLTHFHMDHVQGLFHLRWGVANHIPVYCPPDSQGCDDLFKHPGILDFQPQRKFKSFSLGELHITPLPLIHSRVSFGFMFSFANQHIAYLCDTKGLPPNTLSFLQQQPLDLLVIDTCFPPMVINRNHNNVDDTLYIHEQVQPHRTVLTHIGHDLDLLLADNKIDLPHNVLAGHDDLPVFPY